MHDGTGYLRREGLVFSLLNKRTYPRAPTVICDAASDAMIAAGGPGTL
jgi:hypothetical protein